MTKNNILFFFFFLREKVFFFFFFFCKGKGFLKSEDFVVRHVRQAQWRRSHDIKNERAFNAKSQGCFVLQNSSLHTNERQLDVRYIMYPLGMLTRK